MDRILLGREFLKGMVMGLAIAAPVGPIAILCIRRTLFQGWVAGLLSGLGAATADGVYGCIAGLGFVAVADWFVAQQMPLQWGGGTFLIYLGLKSWRSPGIPMPAFSAVPNATDPATLPRLGWFTAYGSTLALTLTNPATILSFLAIFTGLGVTTVATARGLALALMAGIFVGSALWWLLLSLLVYRLRRHLSTRWIQGINYASGGVMLGFGLMAWVSAIV